MTQYNIAIAGYTMYFNSKSFKNKSVIVGPGMKKNMFHEDNIFIFVLLNSIIFGIPAIEIDNAPHITPVRGLVK